MHRDTDLPLTWIRGAAAAALCFLLGACAAPAAVEMSAGHVLVDDQPDEDIAEVAPEPPRAPIESPPELTYTVVVKDVPVVDLLFSIARDAGLNLDLQADSRKLVTINAVERPLREILNRVAEHASLRFDLLGNNLVVQDDEPYWKNYHVDYVNVSRSSEGEVGVATQISTSGGTVGEDSGGQQQDRQGNLSKTTVRNTSNNDFWAALEAGLVAILHDNEREAAPRDPVEYDPVIVNKMSGVVTVFGSRRQQQRVATHLRSVMTNSQRQVLIEMTIVEVELSDKYQAGVDWQRLSSSGGLGNNGVSVRSEMLGASLAIPPVFSLAYNDDDPNGGNVSATVRLLQEFGDTKVLSSPKIMALNNQTALLKVVEENVFFNVELDVREATADIPERRTFTSTIRTVPVGLVLSVTPQISENGFVSLNIRPTISRITGYAVDPAPRLAGADFDNLIPEIQVREIESLLQVRNGRTVVLGGLMQNERDSEKDGVPGLSRIPKIGKLFSYTRDDVVKTELVIFLRPTIIDNGQHAASVGNLSDYYDASAQSGSAQAIEYR